MLRVIFGVERLFGGFCEKNIRKNTAHIQAKNPWPIPAYFMNVVFRYVHILGFIGAIVADTVCTHCR